MTGEIIFVVVSVPILVFGYFLGRALGQTIRRYGRS